MNHNLRFEVPSKLVHFFTISLSVFYVFVWVLTPIAIRVAQRIDDGNFILRGEYLAEGNWLGPYDWLTLAKAPGYPAFLALTHWLGLSVSLAHALFLCAAVIAFVAICSRFIRSQILSALLFVLLLWQPYSLIQVGILRDNIYPAQVLLFLGAFSYTLFIGKTPAQKFLGSVSSGALLGWIWLTREEGEWLLPGMFVLVVVAAWRSTREHEWRALASSLLLAVAVFFAIQAGLAAINWRVYGKFVGVEQKEKQFKRALGALNSVLSGGRLPRVAVTRAAQEKIFAVSPTFKSLEAYLKGKGRAWERNTCATQPETCGEVGAGFFMWSLRIGAAEAGHYRSPIEASEFYRRIADEVEAACARGQLTCKAPLIPAMPQVTWDQMRQLPKTAFELLNWLLWLHPDLQLAKSAGTPAQLSNALRFLNYPLSTVEQTAPQFLISGWYVNPAKPGGWIWATVVTPQGAPAWTQFESLASPDLAKQSAAATAQRFSLRTQCDGECTLVLQTEDGAGLKKKLKDLREVAPSAFQIANATLYVATAVAQADVPSTSRAQQVAVQVRRFVMINYHIVFIPVLVFGSLCFLVSTVVYTRQSICNNAYVLALACWVLVLSRIFVVAIISVTLFPLPGGYLSAASYLIVAAPLLSIAALLQLARGDKVQISRAFLPTGH